MMNTCLIEKANTHGACSARVCLGSPVGPLAASVIDTPDGPAVASLTFGSAAPVAPAEHSDAARLLDRLAAALDDYFERSDATAFDDLPLAPRGTDFQSRVWQRLRSISFGETISYGELARSVGSPGGARAVGLANARNPIAIIIPCHRVVNSKGEPHGYAGGLDRKRWLLQHEACELLRTR